MEYVAPGGYDQVVFRGSLVDGKAPEFVALWLKGRVLAGTNANVWDVQDDIQKLVRAGFAGTTVDVKRLGDSDWRWRTVSRLCSGSHSIVD